MKIDYAAVVKAVSLAGSAHPAFAALLDVVRPLLDPADQDDLKRTYQQERRDSDGAHAAFRDEFGG